MQAAHRRQASILSSKLRLYLPDRGEQAAPCIHLSTLFVSTTTVDYFFRGEGPRPGPIFY
jgi:hypothetical protein